MLVAPRLRRRLLASASALAVALTAATAASAVHADASAASPASSVQYAVSRNICAKPASPNEMRCFAAERVPVPAGTRHAFAYRPSSGRGPAGGYTPWQLSRAYGFNPWVPRRKMTVAIVLWHDAPTALADLNHFDRRYQLPHESGSSFRKVNQAGHDSPLPAADPGAAAEVALDTQAVRAVCHTCRILLVEAKNPYAGALATAVNTAVRMGAQVVTNSYGAPERRFPSWILKAYNHPGVVLTASTGDDGWYGWDWSNSPGDHSDSRAPFPATSPSVVAVTGTRLQLGAGSTRSDETVWNSNGLSDTAGRRAAQPLGASGGGCSRLFRAPAWQARLPGYQHSGCNGYRLAADLALDADPQTGFDVYRSFVDPRYDRRGWATFGGTSLAAPLAAGMFALAGGAQGARYPADALYGNAAVHPAQRFDVVSGGTGYCQDASTQDCATAVQQMSATSNPNNLKHGQLDCSFPRHGGDGVPASRNRECNALPGYDGASGVGAPAGIRLFHRTDPTVTIGRGPKPVRHGRRTAFTAYLKQPLPHTYLQHIVWYWGDGHGPTARVRQRVAAHVYRRPGGYHLTVVARDSRGQQVVKHALVRVS